MCTVLQSVTCREKPLCCSTSYNAFRILISRIHVYPCICMSVCVCVCVHVYLFVYVCSGLWHILTGYGYQMISEDQKEAEVVKDGHVATLVVSV